MSEKVVGMPTKADKLLAKVKLPRDLKSLLCFLLQKFGNFSTWNDPGELCMAI